MNQSQNHVGGRQQHGLLAYLLGRVTDGLFGLDYSMGMLRQAQG